jgi:hypothetical protein
VDEDTCGEKPDKRVSIIHEKGLGKYRLFMAIEHMIFIFLAHQVGLMHNDDGNLVRYAQYIETAEVDGRTYPMIGGGFQKLGRSDPGSLLVDYSVDVYKHHRAGAVRKF